MWSLIYLIVRTIVRLLVSAGQPGRADRSNDLGSVELAVVAEVEAMATGLARRGRDRRRDRLRPPPDPGRLAP